MPTPPRRDPSSIFALAPASHALSLLQELPVKLLYQQRNTADVQHVQSQWWHTEVLKLSTHANPKGHSNETDTTMVKKTNRPYNANPNRHWATLLVIVKTTVSCNKVECTLMAQLLVSNHSQVVLGQETDSWGGGVSRPTSMIKQQHLQVSTHWGLVFPANKKTRCTLGYSSSLLCLACFQHNKKTQSGQGQWPTLHLLRSELLSTCSAGLVQGKELTTCVFCWWTPRLLEEKHRNLDLAKHPWCSTMKPKASFQHNTLFLSTNSQSFPWTTSYSFPSI